MLKVKGNKTKKIEGKAKKKGFEFNETPTLEEYNKHPLINFEPSSERFGVKLGLKKVAAVLANLEACKAFVASGGKTLDPDEVED